MEYKSFEEIMKMIVRGCDCIFFSGTKDIKATIVECATKIYIAQMKGADNG